MRSVEEHTAAAVALVRQLPAMPVSLDEALGRVLTADVTARWPSPPFTNSAMDGYAVQRSDAVEASPAAPVTLALVGESAAGRPFEGAIGAGQAVRIMTGAPVPSGADAVVPVEQADYDGNHVVVREAPREGAHIRHAGEDVAEGDVVLAAGLVLTPARLAAAASVGYAHLRVVRQARVAVLTTGDELVAPGSTPGPGQIADSNGVVLANLVRAVGAKVVPMPRTSDDPAALVAALADVDADLIVTTGGVSQGAYDVVKLALASRGVEFTQVAMQPGKPQGLGRLGDTPIVCLPGNPVSVLTSFVAFVVPMLRALHGEPAVPVREATVGAGWVSPQGRAQFMPVRWDNGAVVPATPGGSGSHLVARLAAAEALAVVPAANGEVRTGDTVVVMEIPA